VPVCVVRIDHDHGVVGGAAAQGARARIENPVDPAAKKWDADHWTQLSHVSSDLRTSGSPAPITPTVERSRCATIGPFFASQNRSCAAWFRNSLTHEAARCGGTLERSWKRYGPVAPVPPSGLKAARM